MEKEFDFGTIGKQVPYTVSDGFFEKATSDTLCRLRKRRQNRILKRVVGVAASIILVCCVSMFYLERPRLTMDELITKMSDSELETLMLMSENDVLVNEEL